MTIKIEDINDEGLKHSLAFYVEEKTKVHVVLKNRRFYNGIIQEVRSAMLILEDTKLGRIPIPLTDIHLIENFREPDNGY